jgi:ATP-dependent RNA helicase DDX18/HAS1
MRSRYYPHSKLMGDAKRSLGDATSSLGDAKSSLGVVVGTQAVAKSFGFNCPPKVQLALESRTKHTRKAENHKQSGAGKSMSGGGRSFSAENPYGKKEKGDTRQFTR